MPKFTHTDNKGKARMVDVGNKPDKERIAVAEGSIKLDNETLKLIQENLVQKGDVIAVARIAGIQAAKKTAELIPLCHPLAIHHIDIKEIFLQDGIRIRAEVKTIGKTGVEMEALSAVGISLLTIYDMCKAVDKTMVIGEISLIEKKKK